MKQIKKRNKMLRIIVVFLILISIGIVNASLYDSLDNLKGKGCSLENYESVFDSSLINEFGLDNSNESCVFIIDSYDNGYSSLTSNLTYFPNPFFMYAEINYVISEGKNYVLLLGNSTLGVKDSVSLISNYTNYESILNSVNDIFSFTEMPQQDEVSEDDCQDNSIENIYIGNQGSYWNGSETISFNSHCLELNNTLLLVYPYCDGMGNHRILVLEDNCVDGKYIAKSSDIFYYIKYFGDYRAPRGREIGSEFLSDAINSWVNDI